MEIHAHHPQASSSLNNDEISLPSCYIFYHASKLVNLRVGLIVFPIGDYIPYWVDSIRLIFLIPTRMRISYR